MLNSTRFALFGLVVASAIWGGSFIAIKVAAAALDPFLVIFGRLAIAALVLLALRRYWGPLPWQRGDWPLLGLMVLCEPFLYFMLETHALRYTSSAAAATLVALLPLAVALTARRLLAERVTARVWQGLALALAGTLLLTGSGQVSALAPRPWLGNLLELGALLTAVGYTLAVKRLTDRYSALFLTALQALAGTVLFAPFLLRPAVWDGQPVSMTAVLAVVYLGTVVNVLAYWLYNHALSRLPASQVCVYTCLIPVFAAVIGRVLLGEELTPWQGVAVLLVVAGVVYSQGVETAPAVPAAVVLTGERAD